MFWLLLLAVQAPGVQVEQLDGTGFLLSLPVDPKLGVAQAQARTNAAADRACGMRLPIYGRFRFLADYGGTRFEQELLCLAGREKLDIAAASGDAPLEPSRGDQHQALAATYGYFAHKDGARYPAAHKFLSDRMKGRFPLADWTRAARDFDAEAGRVRARRVVEISWYKDPADAPEPGLYVAADFSAEFERTEFVCGYLMWQVTTDGGFRLVREEQNIAPKRASGRAIAQIDRDPLRVRMGCKD